MKLVKMSLAAAVLLGASAFAIDNVKVSGDAKLFYATDSADYIDINSNLDATPRNGMFDKGASAADTALRLGVTGDLTKGVSFGVTGYAVSTLGLENNLVDKVWTGAHDVTTGNGAQYANALGGAQADDQAWIGEMWVAATLGKTTAKLGRMELDTPLAFSEKWSIVPNTFDAAVIINQDIPDTTVVAAWVGKGNGVNIVSGINTPTAQALAGTVGYKMNYDGGVVGAGADMVNFMADGAYAAAIVNNSYKPATLQAWYYNVVDIADAYWLQADINCQLVKGLTIGAQYADMDTKGLVAAAHDSSAYAFKLGYNGIPNLKLSAAYSDADNDNVLNVANVATSSGQSKLYTEAWWNYGYVSAAGAESVNVTAEYDAGVAKVGAYYTDVNNDIAGSTHEMTEIALTASKSFGPLDATLAYISTDADDQNMLDGSAARYDTIQAYLTLNF